MQVRLCPQQRGVQHAEIDRGIWGLSITSYTLCQLALQQKEVLKMNLKFCGILH